MKQKEKKCGKFIFIGISIGIVGGILGIILDRVLLQKWNFFEINLKDIIQMAIDIFIGYILYRLAKKDNKRDKINSKAKEILEKIIYIIDNKITPLENCITVESLKINIKELSNNILILKKILLVNKEYEEDINYIDEKFVKFEAYISEHTDMTIAELLNDEMRKNKITNYIVNIRSRALDMECSILID